MFKNNKLAHILISIIAVVSIFGCTVNNSTDETLFENNNQKSNAEDLNIDKEIISVSKDNPSENHLSDNMLLYEDEDDYGVITMYLTVSFGNEADGSNHTWNEVNTYSDIDYTNMGVDRYKVEGLLQIDDTGKGITKDSYGYNETIPNVSVQVRGQTSTEYSKKNYKIRIKDGKEEYKGQRTLNLNKHMYEPYRFVNKMCFDMLDNIPQLISARTQFVHLYVKDLTENGEGEYEDYGLYTMVEQINRTYLKNHNLDENGQLYKVTFFEWGLYDEVMMDYDDPDFDMAKFEEFMEIKGDEDLTKLQEIVKKVNNYNIPIDEILEENFDTENICYWMAYNILIGNDDCGSRNLFLYSPLNSEKYYFICWDMDACFQHSYNQSVSYHDGESWENGMSTFLALHLINRMMREEKYRDMLKDAVDDLYANYVNKKIVDERVENYKEVLLQYLYTDPIIDEDPISSLETYNELTSMLGSEVDSNYKNFLDSLKKPWPFYVGVPIKDETTGKVVFNWDVSYEINGQDVYYDFILARDPYFEDVVYEAHYLEVPGFTGDDLNPGTYYIRVVATNESGYSMDCYDYFPIEGYGKQYGCYCFVINRNGTIESYEDE